MVIEQKKLKIKKEDHDCNEDIELEKLLKQTLRDKNDIAITPTPKFKQEVFR